MSKISVVTVTYNNESTIKDYLESIKNYSPKAEVIIVDNGSSDETLKIIRDFGGQVRLIEAGQNLGFSKGNNLGVKHASGEFLVFLNPDAFLMKKGDLEYLQKLGIENPQYGILAPKLIYADKTPQPRVRNLPTLERAFAEYVLGSKNAYSFYEPNCNNLCEVESVIGACLIIKKDLFLNAGGFNEKYFMYYEDLELCKSVKNLGYKIGFVPDIVVTHAEGVSGKNQKTNKLMKGSAKKYFGLWTYSLLELIFFYNRVVNRLRKLVDKPVHV